jgi:hypothetical protein
MVQMTLSRIVGAAIVGLALTVSVSAGAQQLVNEVRPYSGTTLNPCNGEAVTFSGTVHYHEKTQVSTDGRIHVVVNENYSVSGRGQRTGVAYNMSGNMHANSKIPAFPISFRSRSRFISTASTVPSFHMTTIFRINGHGIQTTATTESDCKG